jgi:hypothetical protein
VPQAPYSAQITPRINKPVRILLFKSVKKPVHLPLKGPRFLTVMLSKIGSPCLPKLLPDPVKKPDEFFVPVFKTCGSTAKCRSFFIGRQARLALNLHPVQNGVDLLPRCGNFGSCPVKRFNETG